MDDPEVQGGETVLFSEEELTVVEKVLQEVEWVGAAEFARLTDEEEKAFTSFRLKLSASLGKRTHHE